MNDMDLHGPSFLIVSVAMVEDVPTRRYCRAL